MGELDYWTREERANEHDKQLERWAVYDVAFRDEHVHYGEIVNVLGNERMSATVNTAAPGVWYCRACNDWYRMPRPERGYPAGHETDHRFDAGGRTLTPDSPTPTLTLRDRAWLTLKRLFLSPFR